MRVCDQNSKVIDHVQRSNPKDLRLETFTQSARRLEQTRIFHRTHEPATVSGRRHLRRAVAEVRVGDLAERAVLWDRACLEVRLDRTRRAQARSRDRGVL
jgi:hypothetical protein